MTGNNPRYFGVLGEEYIKQNPNGVLFYGDLVTKIEALFWECSV